MLDFALSLFEPTYKDGTTSRRFAGTVNVDNVTCPSDGEVGGNTEARVSPFSATVGFNWSADFSERVGWYVRGDLSHQSQQHLEEMNLGWIGARTLANGSIGLTGENWDAQLWGKNLTDEEYLTSSLFIIQFGSYRPSLGEQRTAGVSLTWKL